MRVAFATFTDPDEFAATLQPSTVELIPLERGRFAVESVDVELTRLRLRRMREAWPLLAHVHHPPHRIYFGFLSSETASPIMVDGTSVTADAMLQFGSAPDSSRHSFGPTEWSSISLDRAELHSLTPEIAELEFAACGAAHIVVPDKKAMCRLRGLHADAIALATHSSASIDRPEAARAMETQIAEAMVDCLSGSEQATSTSLQTRRAALTERFRDLLDANMDRALYLPEVCASLGVSHRSLSYCCQDVLGTSPKRYFFLRRMHMVRRALRKADRHSTTVTEIATRHGFWEFGRFSMQYKALFGEAPSATLRRESRNAED